MGSDKLNRHFSLKILRKRLELELQSETVSSIFDRFFARGSCGSNDQ
jgi:hypothetical protein